MLKQKAGRFVEAKMTFMQVWGGHFAKGLGEEEAVAKLP